MSDADVTSDVLLECDQYRLHQGDEKIDVSDRMHIQQI